MIWVDIIISIIFIFVFIGGLRQGAFRSIFSFISLIIAIPVTGLLYHFLVKIFSFVHDENWANFLGFLITFIVISILLSLIFWIPRKIMKLGEGGILSAIIGGVFALAGFSIALVLFNILIETYPVWNWLVGVLEGSQIIKVLLAIFGFIKFMLPETFRTASLTLQHFIYI
jgi:uncharacterized membrane protein required for colicin V production